MWVCGAVPISIFSFFAKTYWSTPTLSFFSCHTWYSLEVYSFIWAFLLPCLRQIGTFLPSVFLPAHANTLQLPRETTGPEILIHPYHKGSWLVTSHILLYLAKSQPFPGSQDKNTLCALGFFSFQPRTSKCTGRHFGSNEPLEVSSTKSTKRIWSMSADSDLTWI